MNRILDLLMKLVSFGKKEGVCNRVQSSFNPSEGVGKRLFFSLFILSLTFSFPLWGQGGTFPVQVITQAIPPAPIYVSNYADASAVNGPLRVQIVLNDFEITNREIRIKTFFTGSGLSFQSNDIVVGADPLFLTGGTPLVLTNVELAPYFRFENLTGINGNQYGNPIPEGAYQFCVEVFDVLTGSRLSNRSCAVSVVFQNEPPILVLPRNRSNVEEINPQYIVFQWTPRSINVSNVEYELSLVEIWDTQVDPQQAFLSSPPVFLTTTSATTYVYGPSDPQLLSGKNYAWRIQAKAKQGTEEIGLFKNQGNSEIFSFSYAGACGLPLAINHEVKGSTNANILWDDFSTEIPEFTVRYRQKNVADAEWFLEKTTFNELTIWNLKAGTTYEYQLSKNCGIAQSDWSFTKEFTTALEFEEESVLDCGVNPDINLTNMEPLASIGTGATFKAGDFPVKILEVSGASGRFTGKGYVTLPYLKNIKVAVEFTNILINTDQEMAEGSVRTAYDASWGNILDTGDVIDVLDDVGDAFSGGDNIDYDVDFVITSVDNIKIEDGKIQITGPNGETTTLDHDDGDTYQITDGSGNTYNIDEDGKITKGAEAAEGGQATAQNTDGVSGGSGTADAPSVTEITASGVTVTFKKSTTTKYDLDSADSDFERARYPKAQSANGTDYYPIHKAVVDGQSDEFLAEISISNSNISIDDLIVKTVSGSKIDTRKEGTSNLIISLKGVNSYRSEEAIVTYKDENGKYKIAASFFIHHIKQQELVKVVVVSVNGTAPLANLEQELNSIYGKAGASFKVSNSALSLVPSDWDDNNNGELDYDGSGLLSDYPQELKNIQQKYKQDNSGWDATAYHLFLLPNTMSLTKPLSGFMPKTRQWGYIFNAHTDDALENKSSQNLVAAHELGHGVFKLPHPFQNDENKSGSGSNWLMDYNAGDQLPYAHWAAMSDESLQLFLFQDDEDSESVDSTDPVLIQLKSLSANTGAKHFAIKHCDECPSNQTISDSGYISFNSLTQQQKGFFDYQEIQGADLVGHQIIFDENDRRCFVLYFKENSQFIDFSLEESANSGNIEKGLWFVNKENNEITNCSAEVTESLKSGLCNSIVQIDKKAEFAPPQGSTYLEKLFEAINSCISTDDIGVSKITAILQQGKEDARDNQLIEFTQNGKVYRLNAQNQATEITNFISDNYINNGNWDDSDIDIIGRLHYTSNGNLNFKALGIRSNIGTNGKDADIGELSNLIRTKTNLFLSENLVIDVTDTPASKGINLNNGQEVFADGKRLEIDNNSNHLKIGYEGLGLLTTFLKTTKIEQKTYLNSTEGQVTIHGPPIVTGTLEAGAKALTDITSVVGMVYELAVDPKVRTETWQGMKKIGVQVQDKPSSLFPILTEVALEEISGNTSDEWSELDNPSGDDGRKGHIVTKGAVRAVSSVFLGGKFIAKLPKMADEIVEKMLKAKLLEKLKSSANFSEDLLQIFRKNLTEIIELYPNIGESIMKIADFSSADELFKIVEQMKKLKNVDGIDEVVKDMGTYWTKFKGSSFQLEYFTKKLDELGAQVSELKFEVKGSITLNGEEVGRIYDGILRGVKYELKNWNNFYPSTIRTQLLRDLQNINSLDELQWVFKSTNNIEKLGDLKKKVVAALKKADGITPIDALNDIPFAKVDELFGDYIDNLTPANKTSKIIEALEDDTIFDLIFEIAD